MGAEVLLNDTKFNTGVGHGRLYDGKSFSAQVGWDNSPSSFCALYM